MICLFHIFSFDSNDSKIKRNKLIKLVAWKCRKNLHYSGNSINFKKDRGVSRLMKLIFQYFSFQIFFFKCLLNIYQIISGWNETFLARIWVRNDFLFLVFNFFTEFETPWNDRRHKQLMMDLNSNTRWTRLLWRIERILVDASFRKNQFFFISFWKQISKMS